MGECYACGTWTATAGYGDRRGWSLFRGCQGGFYNRWVQSSGDIMGYTHNHIMRICMLCSVVYIYICIYCLMLCCIMLCCIMLCYAYFYVYVHVYVYVYAYVILCHGMFSLCIISCLSKSYFMLSPWGF